MNALNLRVAAALAVVFACDIAAAQTLPFSWDGRQFPTLEAAELAMRAHPANAPIGSDLVLCGDDAGNGQVNGQVLYRYCAKPKPVIPTGAGGYWMSDYGFQCETNADLVPGFEGWSSRSHGCLRRDENSLVSAYLDWLTTRSRFAGACNLKAEIKGSFAEPLAYWGTVWNHAPNGPIDYRYVISFHTREHEQYRRVEWQWTVRNSDGSCPASPVHTQSAGVQREYSFRCPAGYSPVNQGAPPDSFNLSAWPNICVAQPYMPVIHQAVATSVADFDLNGELCEGQNSEPILAGANGTNPIHSALGVKIQREIDFVLDDGFVLERTYMSQGARATGRFGWGWRNPLDRHFIPYFPGASATAPGRLWIRFGPGDALTAVRNSASGWELESVKKDVVVRNAVVDGQDGIEIVDGRGVTRYTLDGRLISWRALGEQPVTYFYDNERRVVELRSAEGRRLLFEYGFANEPITKSSHERRSAVTAVVLPDGGRIEYLYEHVSVVDEAALPFPRGGYSPKINRLVGVRYPDGRIRRYHYEAPPVPFSTAWRSGSFESSRAWLLTGITDERGRRFANWTYDDNNRAVLSVHGESGDSTDRVTLDYAVPHKRTRITDELGNARDFEFTIINGEAKLTRLSGPSAQCGNRYGSLSYDGNGHLQTATDFNNRQHTFAHDDRGRRTRHTEGVGTPQERTTETDWHAVYSVPVEERVKNAAGTVVQRTVYTHDALGNVLSVTVSDPVAGTSRALTATRDPEGRLLTIDGPRTDVADITTYTYFNAEDPACASSPTTCSFRKGDLKSVTNARGHTTHFLRYDGAGRLLESRDANGLVSTFTYTPRGWLASRTVGGLTTAITYTAVGDVESVTTPDGRSLTYTYDSARRLTAVRDQRGNRIDWTLDNAGNRTAEAVKDASGTLRRTLTQQFNTLGRLSQAANAAGRATLFTQDANGNLDLASDPLNRTTDQDVDALDRVTKQLQDVAGLNVETQFGYDALDQLTTVTDPKGLITRYTNDGLGNLLKLESPDTGTTTYTVDAAGNRSSQTDARGITVGYTYDALNRLTGIRFPTAALNTTFVYDSATGCPAGETFALGRLSSMTDASGSTRWCYDLLGRLTRKVQVTNGRTFTTAYAYDAQGRLAAQTLPSGAIVRFGYATGEVNTVAVRLPGSSVDLPLINGIERLPFGPVSKLTYGNGRTQTRAYDLDYAIDRITSSEASGWTQDYGVDAVGNITAILGTGANNRFRYDGLDRLTHADNTSNVTQRAYPVDKTGNRTGKQTAANGAITPYVYAATNHRLAQTGTEARTYDAVGNPLTIGTRTLTYDERSRLTVFVNGTTTRRYQYTGQGLRVRKWTSSNTSGNTYFVYNENAQLIGEYDNAGARVQEIVWLGNLPIGVIAGTAAVPVLHYIESDHLGTPRVIVDATRNVGIWRWNQTNDPFGESTPNQNPDGDATSFTFNLRFAGQYRDSESGWYYNVHRYYDPATGRYLESDPIGLNGGISTYGYVGANPLFYVDPLGLEGTRWWDLPGHIQNWGADVANLSRARGEIQGASIGAGQYGYPSPDPAAASRVNDALLERGQQAGTVAAASMSLPLLAELLPASAIRHGLGSAADDVVAACRSPEAREAVFRACVAVNFCDVHTNGRLPKDLPEDGWIQARNIGQEVREAGMREAMRNGQVTYPKP